MAEQYFLCLSVFFSIFSGLVVPNCDAGTAILAVRFQGVWTTSPKFCVLTDSCWNASIPEAEEPVYWQPMSGLEETLGCQQMLPARGGSNSVLVNRGNCTFFEKGMWSHRSGYNLTVVANSGSDDMTEPSCGNSSLLTAGNVQVVMATYQDSQWFREHGSEEVEVSLYASPPNALLALPTLAAMLVVALFTLVTGSFWAQASADFLNYGLLQRRGEFEAEEEEAAKEGKKVKTWQKAIVFAATFAAMITFVMLLFFFWNVMIYVVVVLFTFTATVSVFSLVSPLVALVPVMATWRVPDWPWLRKVPILRYRPDPRFFITLVPILVLTIWWAIERNSRYSWILLVILGYSIVVTVYRTYRRVILKLWIFTVFLSVFLVYDVFFVYLTRYMTEDGTSVMERIVTGFEGAETSDCEMLPFAFKIPKFFVSEQSSLCSQYRPCLSGYDILGFGDVALPGLLVSYCLYVDLTYHSKRWLKVYFIVACVGYVCGLLTTFTVMMWSRSGQPALLFLVPCTLLPTLLCAALHREFSTLWRGLPFLTKGPKSVSFKDLQTQNEYNSDGETELEEFDLKPDMVYQPRQMANPDSVLESPSDEESLYCRSATNTAATAKPLVEGTGEKQYRHGDDHEDDDNSSESNMLLQTPG